MKKPYRLFDFSNFAHVFEPYRGMDAIYFAGTGNVGDRIIELGTQQLFEHYQINIDNSKPKVAFYAGGGNMGPLYPDPNETREILRIEAETFGIPIVVLPQSWTGADSFIANKYFVREMHSLQFAPDNAVLAPDLGLAYLPSHLTVEPPIKDIGHFFRTDAETSKIPENNIGDPVDNLDYFDSDAYIRLAWDYKTIHTNRLHFAIAALIGGRDVTLYPNSYYKNRAIWECWLKDKGCKWGEI